MEYVKINSWNETDPLRTILFGNIDNSYNLPEEFPCQVRSFNTCKNNIKMEKTEIKNANYLRKNLCNARNFYRFLPTTVNSTNTQTIPLRTKIYCQKDNE